MTRAFTTSALLIAALTATLPSRASAQPPARPLALAEETKNDLAKTGGSRDVVVAVGPDGRLIVAPRVGWGGSVVGYDSAGAALALKLMIGYNDKADVGGVRRMGWMGATTTMWIDDPIDKEIALVDPHGTITKSIEFASWIHPHWAERRNYPLFRGMEPVAVYADETMLIVPSNERSFFSTPAFDRSSQHLLRVTWSGAIERTVATLPANAERPPLFIGRGPRPIVLPFAARSFWTVSPDGSRIAIVQPLTAEADSGAFRVTVLGERGDTVFNRRYPYVAARVPKANVDNFLASVRPAGKLTADQRRDSIVKAIPAFQSFLTGVLVGRDQSTWVLLRPVADTSKERVALVLDPRGEVFGMATIPADHEPVAASLDRLWALEMGRVHTPIAVVRYAVRATGAPPPHSPKGATPSAQRRPPR